MPEQATQFANFIKYLKDHHLEAPKFGLSDHYFLRTNKEPSYEFEPMETNKQEFSPCSVAPEVLSTPSECPATESNKDLILSTKEVGPRKPVR